MGAAVTLVGLVVLRRLLRLPSGRASADLDGGTDVRRPGSGVRGSGFLLLIAPTSEVFRWAPGEVFSSSRAETRSVPAVGHNARVSWSRRVAAGLLLVLTVGGWVGGISFLADPSGGTLGMSPRQLPHWPLLDDYAVPGLLILLFGVLPVLALLALVRRPRLGWPATAAVRVLIVWMLVQFVALGLLLPGVQLAFLAVGALLVALAAFSKA
jgi:hypothetical protein